MFFGCWVAFPFVALRGDSGYRIAYIVATGVSVCLILFSGNVAAPQRVTTPLQLFVLPLLIVLSLVVARVDGTHYAPVAAILTPFWFFEACMLVSELFSPPRPDAE